MKTYGYEIFYKVHKASKIIAMVLYDSVPNWYIPNNTQEGYHRSILIENGL
jgi:hypothetical protein